MEDKLGYYEDEILIELMKSGGATCRMPETRESLPNIGAEIESGAVHCGIFA
jgi:hypothetical protein